MRLPTLALDIAKHDAQYPPIPVQVFSKSHDRFLIIDDRVYHVGASIKDLGLKMDNQDPNELISKLSFAKAHNGPAASVELIISLTANYGK